VDKWTRPAHAYAAADAHDEWYCPMHPQVVRSRAGQCPICNMDLKRRDPKERAGAVTDRVQLSRKNGLIGAIMVLRTNASWSEGRPERGHRHVSISRF